MDPITAIGAVASVVQLAGAALSLSQTLYTLGSAVVSAGEDVQALADDLKTFSQSLTLLSRLLEDSKSWYTDDIYLLTAKIIKDCSELYLKIDKVLIKLGGNGKSTWKLRVKFVYKESQIRKLLARLRDMKGTLATILMSLQVDLQLSLLNISSSSKIQRGHEQPLLPQTIETLKDAQKAVESNVIISRYAFSSQTTSHSPEKGPQVSTTQYEAAHISAQSSFMVLPSPPANAMSGTQTGPTRGISSQTPDASTDFAFQTTANQSVSQIGGFGVEAQLIKGQAELASSAAAAKDNSSSSLKSSTSVESFKSALSSQGTSTDIIDDVSAVQGVLHSFRTAIETLKSFILKRDPISKNKSLYFAIGALERSLVNGEKEVNAAHKSHYKKHGQRYIEYFTESEENKLQKISTVLLEQVVLFLHQRSAEHVVLQNFEFDIVCQRSNTCRTQAISLLNEIASPLDTFPARPIPSQTNKTTLPQRQTQQAPLPISWNSQPGPPAQSQRQEYRYTNASPGPPFAFPRIRDIAHGRREKTPPLPSSLSSPASDGSEKNAFGMNRTRRKRPIPKLENSEETMNMDLDFRDPIAQGEDLFRPPPIANSPFSSYDFDNFLRDDQTVSGPFAPSSEQSHLFGRPISQTDNTFNQPQVHNDISSPDLPTLSPPEGSNTLFGKPVTTDADSLLLFGDSTAPNANEAYKAGSYGDFSMDFGLDTFSQSTSWNAPVSQNPATDSIFDPFFFGDSTPQTGNPLEKALGVPPEHSSNYKAASDEATNTTGTNPFASGAYYSSEPYPSLTQSSVAVKDDAEEKIYPRFPNVFADLNAGQELWWQSYSLFSSNHPSLFSILEELLALESGSIDPRLDFDSAVPKELSSYVRRASHAVTKHPVELSTLLESRETTLRIITTIDDSLKLELATLGWSCLSLLLTMFDPVLTADPSTPLSADSISSLTTVFQQLQEIAGVIARYAIMENLYNQKGNTLTLRPEYQTSLLDLCVTILKYFSNAFVVAKSFHNTTAKGSQFGVVQAGMVQASVMIRDELIEEIKKKDKACQGFRVVVKTVEYSDSDSDDIDDDDSDKSGDSTLTV